MMNRLPHISSAEKICIICEGPEEYEYLEQIKKIGVWNAAYDVTLINAKGNGNIPARYQDKYQNGDYDLILVFCDTDHKPYEQYNDIKRKINEFHGVPNAADAVIMFGNPCTMQIVLQHWDTVRLKTQAKASNAPLIEKYTGVSGYKGRADQRKAIYEQITEANYKNMVNRVRSLPDDDTIIGSSNFDRFMRFLESSSKKWIQNINAILEAGI